jgi:hypothetical protein
MSAISEMAIDNVLHPKIANMFRVKFYKTGTLDPVERLIPLSFQIVSVEPAGVSYDNSYHEPYLTFVFEDDILNNAVGGVLKTMKEQADPMVTSDLDIALEVLDGNETMLERITYKNCIFEGLSHVSVYNYASGLSNERVKASFYPKEIIGNAVSELPGGEDFMKSLKHFFDTLEICITGLNVDESRSALIKRRVTVAFMSQETTLLIGDELVTI